MKKTLYYSVIVLLCCASPTHAAQVYTGCAVPPSTFRHVWYFDPVHGKTELAGGNGSQTAPWNNLQALVQAETGYSFPLLTTAPYRQVPVPGQPAVNKTGPQAGPVAPGDEILLRSGNYGDVFITASPAISNSNFVTVAAAPGQTPVLTSLFIGETNKWVFNGIKVQSLQHAARSGNALVQIKDAGATLPPTSDIVLENLTISSQDSAEGWSQAQWRADARNGFSALSTAPGTNTECVSLTGSHVSNVRFGASLFASKLVFSNNQIDHFGDDRIDYAASNLAITKNNIHDNLDIGDGSHEDAMQGQVGILAPGATVNHFQNVLIDSNMVIRQTDPKLAFPTYLQGIDAFDSDWTNVTVTNNVVITSACSGIAFSSIHKSLIANNTVVTDGLVATAGGCPPAVSVGDKTHEGSSSSNTVVRNNLASEITVYNLDTGVEADHNVGMLRMGPALSWYVNGVPQYYSKAGTYPNGNVIDSGGPTSEFVDFDPSRLAYNVILKYGAAAISAGTVTGAPTVDILDVARAPQHTAGAYSYPK